MARNIPRRSTRRSRGPGVRSSIERAMVTRSFFVRRRGCLLWVSGGALGWLVTSACSSSGDGATLVSSEGTSPSPPSPTLAEGEEQSEAPPKTPSGAADASIEDAAGDAEASAPKTVTLYDTYAVALYFDGTLGPKTGIIKVADVAAGKTLAMDFWHGHGGVLHRFTLTPDDFAKLKAKQKVTTK